MTRLTLAVFLISAVFPVFPQMPATRLNPASAATPAG